MEIIAIWIFKRMIFKLAKTNQHKIKSQIYLKVKKKTYLFK